MLLALTPEKTTLLVCLIAALIIHYFLALFATARLLRFKAKGLPDVVWHFIIQLGIIIGPLVFLLIHPKRNLHLKPAWQVKPKETVEKETDEDTTLNK